MYCLYILILCILCVLIERRAEEERRKEQEKKWKYEEEMSHLLGTWKREILPSWDIV